jgi:hypothetical protein
VSKVTHFLNGEIRNEKFPESRKEQVFSQEIIFVESSHGGERPSHPVRGRFGCAAKVPFHVPPNGIFTWSCARYRTHVRALPAHFDGGTTHVWSTAGFVVSEHTLGPRSIDPSRFVFSTPKMKKKDWLPDAEVNVSRLEP